MYWTVVLQREVAEVMICPVGGWAVAQEGPAWVESPDRISWTIS